MNTVSWQALLFTLFNVRAWLNVMAAPLPCALLFCLLATTAFKIESWMQIDESLRSMRDIPAIVSADFMLFMAVIAVTYTAPMAKWFIRWPVRIFGFWVLSSASVDLAYLFLTGAPQRLAVLQLRVEPIHDALQIIEAAVMKNPTNSMLILSGLALLHLTIRLAMWIEPESDEENDGETTEEGAGPHDPIEAKIQERKLAEARAWKTIAGLSPALAGVLACLVWLLMPQPTSSKVAKLAYNGTVGSARSFEWLSIDWLFGQGEPTSISFGPLVERGAIQPSKHRYDTLLVILESTGSLDADLGVESRTSMPKLRGLAKRGLWSSRARTPMPETSKSLFGILCGRMPLWQPALREASEEVRIRCLPHTLDEVGYATAFFQSGIGALDDRPRLVSKLGFEHFEAWENIRGEPSGESSSDDLSLADAFDAWLDRLPEDQPFFATVLTSGPRPPYGLPPSMKAELRARGIETDDLGAPARFELLVERQDALLGRLVDRLEARGRVDETLIVVVGNRGVGFRRSNVQGRSDNPYEEALRVPLVMAGPPVREGELERDVSLLDIAPTLAETLGFQVALPFGDMTGRSLLRGGSPERVFPFSCLHERACAGYARPPIKMIIFPAQDVSRSFDLAEDPGEARPKRVWPSADETLAEIHDAMHDYRIALQPNTLAKVEFDSGWVCEEGRACEHPATPEGASFEETSTTR